MNNIQKCLACGMEVYEPTLRLVKTPTLATKQVMQQITILNEELKKEHDDLWWGIKQLFIENHKSCYYDN